MSTDATKLIRLQGWLSPAFPIGSYSYSHALERAVESGAVRDRVTLVDWLDADLRHGAGRADGIFFAQAWRAAEASAPSPGSASCGCDGVDSPQAKYSPLPWRERADAVRRPGEGAEASAITAFEAGPSPHKLLAIAALAAAMRGTAELALESLQQGVAFLTTVRRAWPHPHLDALTDALKAASIPITFPIAVGMACAAHRIPLEPALPLFLHAGAANWVNAALRLIPLGQSDGQVAMAALEAAIIETARAALSADISDIGSASFMIDIMSMQHETQYTRLFRS